MSRLRTLSVGAGTLLVLEAVALIVVLAAANRRTLLPVYGEFAAGTGESSGGPIRALLSQIDVGVAAVVLCLFVAVARLLPAVPRVFGHQAREVPESLRTARWVEFSFTSSITVFLVAQLNGVVDLVALVLVYAATSGMSLFGILQQRVLVRAAHPLLPLCFAAALGIVPWGVIAFTQIGSGLAGATLPGTVRVITLVMLAFAFAFAITQWREQSRRVRAMTADERGERMHVVLSFASVSVFAWSVVLGIVVS